MQCECWCSNYVSIAWIPDRAKRHKLLLGLNGSSGRAGGTYHDAGKAENDELRERVNTLQVGDCGGSSPVDVKLLSKLSEFEGKDEEWTRFSLNTKAFLGVIDPDTTSFIRSQRTRAESRSRRSRPL